MGLALLTAVAATACDSNNDSNGLADAGKTPVGIGDITIVAKEKTRAATDQPVQSTPFDRDYLTVIAKNKDDGKSISSDFTKVDGTFISNPTLYVEDVMPTDEFEFTMASGDKEEVIDQSNVADFARADYLEGTAQIKGKDIYCNELAHQKPLLKVIIKNDPLNATTFNALKEDKRVLFFTAGYNPVKALRETDADGNLVFSACILPSNATRNGKGRFTLMTENDDKAEIKGTFELPDGKGELLGEESVEVTVKPYLNAAVTTKVVISTAWNDGGTYKSIANVLPVNK